MKLAYQLAGINQRQSPPARGRGLKPQNRLHQNKGMKSPPARGRGLKLNLEGGDLAIQGRPPRGGVD